MENFGKKIDDSTENTYNSKQKFNGIECDTVIFLWILLWLVVSFFSLLFSYILLIIISSLFVDMNKEYETDSRYYRWLLNSSTAIAVKLIRIHVRVSGREQLPEGRFLMVSNHRSKFDPILSWHIFSKENLSFISKPENFRVPVYGRLIHRCCFMAIDRENPRKALKTIIRATDLINRDVASVAVYPEGTRNTGEGLLPMHNAVFKIAQKAHVPIAVVAVRDADLIHKQYPLHKSVVYIDVVRVLSADEVKAMKTADIGETVSELLTQKLSEEREA